MKRRAKVVPAARYTVDAAAKALELLSVFSFREPRLSLADLASRTGIPRATAFRLLSTLEQSGFLDKVHGAYQLGIKCFVLGNIVAGGLDLRETARPHLAALREATRETTQIAILDHWQVVYLERMLSPMSVGYMRSRAGAILPAYCTGLGKTLLAFRPEAEVAGLGRDPEVHGADAAHDHLGQAAAEGAGASSASAATASTRRSARRASAALRRRSSTTPATSSPRSAWPDRPSACRAISWAARSRRPSSPPHARFRSIWGPWSTSDPSMRTAPRRRRMEDEGEESRARSRRGCVRVPASGARSRRRP